VSGRRESWWDARGTLAVIAAVGALGIASFAWIYGAGLTYYGTGPIHSDGVGYYVYLPAVLLNHEVSFVKTGARSFGGDPAYIPGVHHVPPDDRALNQYGIGEAVMLAPFFAVGHLIAVRADERRDGFSWPYEWTAAIGGFLYALLGIAVLGSVLRRWFSSAVVTVTLLAIVFGTSLFNYLTYDSVFSHAFSFALVAVIVRLTIAVADRPRAALAAGLGASLGLLALVRPTNLVVVIFCVLYGIRGTGDLRPRVAALLGRFDLVALGSGVFLALLIPQLAYWHEITGEFVTYPYKSDEQLDLLHPHLLEVLFSVRKGLFFWTPLLLLAVAGLPLLRRFAPGLLVPTVAYLVGHTWVVASWSVWAYGASFGMRPFVEALPILAPGLAALIAAARGARARRLVAVAVVLTTLLAVHGTIAYWLKDVPYDGTTFDQYLGSFWYF
jgi:hypothetical protein